MELTPISVLLSLEPQFEIKRQQASKGFVADNPLVMCRAVIHNAFFSNDTLLLEPICTGGRFTGRQIHATAPWDSQKSDWAGNHP